MSIQWNHLEKKAPYEEKILLVLGPLGIDLAIRLEGNWYFKSGDEWKSSNLEHWYYNTPMYWTEIDVEDELMVLLNEKSVKDMLQEVN